MKAHKASNAVELEHIPNIGSAIADDLRQLGITHPQQLKGMDGIELYLKLNKISGQRHDPCVADTFMAAVDFMNGGAAKSWWKFTDQRKKIFRERGIQ
jgi:hypothetical protein